MLTSRAFLMDPTYVRSVFLRPFARTLLAQTSDADTHAVVGEYSLKSYEWQKPRSDY